MKKVVNATCAAVVAMAVGACSSTGDEAIPIESVPGGQRLAIAGVFEIVAPVVIWSEGGLVFESVSTQRDVVFRDFSAMKRSGEPRVEFTGAGAGSTSAIETTISTAPRGNGVPRADGGASSRRANHARVRRAGRDRYLVDLVDCIDLREGGASRSDIAWTDHFEIDTSSD